MRVGHSLKSQKPGIRGKKSHVFGASGFEVEETRGSTSGFRNREIRIPKREKVPITFVGWLWS
jgi:hypothetical protein